MGNYELCLDCRKKYLLFKRLKKQFKEHKISSKPVQPKFCLECSQHLSIEKDLDHHRYITRDGYMAGSHSNCIVACGYGMWAPRLYKELVIDKRRNG
jgi:hypothetical protein